MLQGSIQNILKVNLHQIVTLGRFIMDFEHVWQQILEIARKRDEICTISQGVPNKILFVHKNAIVVSSERTGNPRYLTKANFIRCWTVLVENGQLSIPPVHVGNERIILALLARLPNVEYSTKPKQTLYFMPWNTHPIGTKREHEQ
jgi:hypothetical protein